MFHTVWPKNHQIQQCCTYLSSEVFENVVKFQNYHTATLNSTDLYIEYNKIKLRPIKKVTLYTTTFKSDDQSVVAYESKESPRFGKIRQIYFDATVAHAPKIENFLLIISKCSTPQFNEHYQAHKINDTKEEIFIPSNKLVKYKTLKLVNMKNGTYVNFY